jgi:hypothetical protein
VFASHLSILLLEGIDLLGVPAGSSRLHLLELKTGKTFLEKLDLLLEEFVVSLEGRTFQQLLLAGCLQGLLQLDLLYCVVFVIREQLVSQFVDGLFEAMFLGFEVLVLGGELLDILGHFLFNELASVDFAL